jgi:hypothetical protein
MKDWRRIRKKLKKIFPDDKMHYYIDGEYFLICSDSFISDELDKLSKVCSEYGKSMWYYLTVVEKDICIVVECL